MFRKSYIICILLILAYLAIRLPVMFRQPGGMDEECYAVPGLTILQTGLPQLPSAPARNLESVFYYADKVLYAEPPVYFYWQSLFYLLLSPTYGAARLSSCIAGIIGLLFLFAAQMRLSQSSSAGCWTIGLLLFSRWFYFPGTSARPDLMCAAFGFAAILSMLIYHKERNIKWLLASGVLIGLGGLTHPFALVYAIQIAVWSLIASTGWRRLGSPAILTVVALATAGLWVPLISISPSIFTVQFKNQFLGDTGGSLWYRVLMPWESLWYHFGSSFGMFNHIEPWQFALALVPLMIMTIQAHRREHQWRPIVWIAWSSIPLMSSLVGPHHSVIGYWVYSAGPMFLCTGYLVDSALRKICCARDEASINGGVESKGEAERNRSTRVRAGLAGALALALCLSLIPGSGLRALVTYVQKWDDIEYDGHRFALELAKSLPKDSIYAVDIPFHFDFLSAGYKTLLLEDSPVYFPLQSHDYDYLIVGRYGIDANIVEKFPVRLIRTEGNKDDLFACYCEIYERVDNK